MSIIINQNQCVGCGKCREVCPGSLLFREEGSNKTYMKYSDECWGCTSCLKECNYKAISYYLGADIGGNGTTFSVTDENKELQWNIVDKTGKTRTIIIDKSKANSY